MQLEELRKKLKKPPAQQERGNRRDAAVLIALTTDAPDVQELSVLFEVRAKNLKVQPGEI